MPNQRKAKYDLFVRQNENIPIFYQPWWLDQVCGPHNWEIILTEDKGGGITGIFTYFKSKSKMLTVISNPFLTPYQGIVLFYPQNLSSITSTYSFENRTISNLLSQFKQPFSYLNLSFHPDFKNWYPFYWKNYKQTTRYTYILNNIKDHKSIYANFDNKLKRQISKSSGSYIIFEEKNTDALFESMKLSLKKQGVAFKMKKEFLAELYRQSANRDQAMVLSAKDRSGKIASSLMMVWDQDFAYSLVIGMDGNIQKNDSLKLLLWESVKLASERVDNYNFEGSMIENVERIFRSFGAKRTPYFNIHKFKNRWLRTLFSLFKK